MANDWQDATLRDVCQLRAGSVFPPALQGKSAGIYPFVKVSDMNLAANVVQIQDANNWVDDDDLFQLKAKVFPPGTTIFAKIGEALKANRLRYIIRPTIIDNNMMGAIPASDAVDSRFLHYALSQFDFGEVAGGTALPYLTVAVLYELKIAIPPLPEQRAIAHILGTLDEKIENLRIQNVSLDAISHALFKAWFVDFEPVRAKLERRWFNNQSLPGLPAHIYEIFPDRLVESKLGEMPEGWEIVPMSKLIEFNPAEPLRKDTEAPYIEMAALPTSGSWPEPPILRAFGSGMRFRNGDTLLARITPCLENGKTAFVQCLPDNTVGWGSTEYIVMRPKPPVPKEFGYLLARNAAFREQAIRSMTGTSGRQRVQADSVAAFKLAVPSSKAVWDAFSHVVEPMFISIKTNEEAIATLVQLRDTLLPKLITGELRVPDAERIVGAAI
ncbi:restriction endonuclease subunit S [Methylophilus sp. 'Pure River']|uniref:restriction endonuclease subunit S n=1 Tax=Methylophilus sp. 'Pure River' TaxID=3377117 RepID=UPI00398F47CE